MRSYFFGEHPFRGLKRLKEDKPETGYLTQEEIALLLSKVDGDNKKIAILCLSTGARWSEAAKLKAENIIQNRVTFVKTKNQQAANRSYIRGTGNNDHNG